MIETAETSSSAAGHHMFSSPHAHAQSSSSAVSTPINGSTSPNVKMASKNSPSSAAVEEVNDSPLVALDKLVASATADAAGRTGGGVVASPAEQNQQRYRITATAGSDENSGGVANRAATMGGSSSPSVPLASAGIIENHNSSTPATPASSRGVHTGPYAGAAKENGTSHHHAPSHVHSHPHQSQHGGVNVVNGKPPKKPPSAIGGGNNTAAAVVRSDCPTAATALSSSSSSPGQMSRDGSGGGGVGGAAELAALGNGGGTSAEAAAPATQQPAAGISSAMAAPQSTAALTASPGGGGASSSENGTGSAFLARNPRDTVPSSSPKRRGRSATPSAGASPAAAKPGGGAGGGRSVEATSQASASSGVGGGVALAPPPPVASISPTRSHASSYAQSSYAQLSLPSSPQGSGAGVAYLVDTSGTALGVPGPPHGHGHGHGHHSASSSAARVTAAASSIIRRSDPDDEEQAMFEQRLCEDEYGVAVRKINSNGRSQLRYVKCVSLAGGYHGGGGGIGEVGGFGAGAGGSHAPGGANASVASATRSVTSSTARSVSSLMGRISRSGRSRGRAAAGDRSKSGRDRSLSVDRSRAGGDVADMDTPSGRHRHASDSPSQASGAAYAAAEDPEQLRNLLSTAPGRRRLALTWGNKKKVRLGLDRFVCVRKGKTTERTRRNPCPPARLLSLITDDRANPSLDIEAPTRLDRDKFARAFARFLGVPLEADTSVDESSDVGGTSVDLENKKRRGSRMHTERFSAAHSAPDLSPSMTLRSASTLTSRSSKATGASAVPQTPERDPTGDLLPAMSQSPSASEDLKLTFDQELPVDPYKGQGGHGKYKGLAIAPSASGSLSSSHAASSNVEIISNAALKNLTSIGRRDEDEDEPDLLGNDVQGDKGEGRTSVAAAASAAPTNQALDRSTRNSLDPVGPDGRHLHHHHHHHHGKPAGLSGEGNSNGGAAPGDDNGDDADGNGNDDDGDAGTDVSSLTQGFDQEIVEELHQALTELRAELEASRAEAARAVKVAEQAIQSAESCTSNDWNSTVTHKAAEAAAKAQKRSAEAMAKQREAEERLSRERRSAQFWRRQAEESEEEKGALRTRAAAAEVQRSAMSSELQGERQRAREDAERLREERARVEEARATDLAKASERNRLLETELDKARRDLTARSKEAKSLHETLTEIKNNPAVIEKGSGRKKLGFGRSSAKKKQQRSQSLLASSDGADIPPFQTPPRPISNSTHSTHGGSADVPPVDSKSLLKVHEDAAQLRIDLDVLRRMAAEEIAALPKEGEEWANRAASAMEAARSEARALRERLARETAMRRKLSDEVGELRGSVRVFCRPRSMQPDGSSAENAILSAMSHDILQMRRDHGLVPAADADANAEPPQPLSFEFDHIFTPDNTQKDVYAEVEKLVLSALDGFNICVMAYGPRGCGKTHTLVGDLTVSLGGHGAEGSDSPAVAIQEYGVHFLTAAQLFSIAEQRRDRYQDSFTITIVEVHNERLRDLLAGTSIAEACGQVVGGDVLPDKKKGKGGQKDRSEDDSNVNSNSSQQCNSTGSKSGNKAGKLEIRTTYDGDTIVQGLIAVPVKSFDDICRVWQECLIERAARLAERGVDAAEYEAESHVIATLSVMSTNTTTGVGTTGKIQFADLACADLIPKRTQIGPGSKEKSSAKQTPTDSVLSGVRNDGTEWKFVNRSLGTLLDVVSARCQFSRSVPYRNSTITHLLRDSLTSDTKVLLLLCVSDEGEHLQETASALRFGTQMRRVAIGKATKHTVSLA